MEGFTQATSEKVYESHVEEVLIQSEVIIEYSIKADGEALTQSIEVKEEI
jgi:hypothetical protein